ncbi:hypothetical protein R6L23_20010 [Streptomyces sp. SR27]|uniref:hypothetical protein n=1 Tax=Streptomyces sp. SR27 TaxID=3076630 RepID=UPI00295A7D5C|nr:hypothetical protein [Streptomyces sp. SR27]MDV9190473.1 hypothetical protein [Streptomyces sp. SR27]
MAMQWGDVPTWVGAVGAGAAAVGALMTLASQRKQIGEQQDFIERQSEVLALQERELVAVASDRTRAQARRISMLASMRDAPPELYPGIENGRCWEVTIRNESDEAIRDINVRCDPYSADAVWDYTPGRTEDGNPKRVGAPVAVLGPGRIVAFFLTPGAAPHIGNYPPVLTFADADGQRWSVDQHGERTRVEQPA